MKNGVLITAHGKFAEGIYSAFRLIAGDMENVEVVNFIEGDTFEILDQQINKAYERLKDFKNVIVLTDLAGGTPFNRAVLCLHEKENVSVLSGMNFAMVYQALTDETTDQNELVQGILEASKDSILQYENNRPDHSMIDDGI